jgi:hypothetical protein
MSDDYCKTYKGRVYHRVHSYPYTRRDGTQTRLIEWATDCEVCGELVLVVTPWAFKDRNFKPNTKCERHRKKGEARASPTG